MTLIAGAEQATSPGLLGALAFHPPSISGAIKFNLDDRPKDDTVRKPESLPDLIDEEMSLPMAYSGSCIGLLPT
ncbi:hypothetical protein D6D02_09670 [Aureobasidium pullulans]|nr:hypothetical protein D6D02_09670 [Aureobasidium pullulans]THY37858.1 hypothetical protein D6C98_10577 [Aureobasidium pullulans]